MWSWHEITLHTYVALKRRQGEYSSGLYDDRACLVVNDEENIAAMIKQVSTIKKSILPKVNQHPGE